MRKIINTYFIMRITQFANSTTIVSNPYFSVSASATASSRVGASNAKSATIIASTLSQRAAISKMNKFLKKHKLENITSTSVTTYKLTGSPAAIWTGVSISGNNAIACVTDYSNAANNLIYYSSDGGKNWSQTSAPTYQWSSVSISDSTALASSFLSAKGIYYSSNSGQTWTSNGNSDSVLNVTINGSNAIKAVFNNNSNTIYYNNNANNPPISWILSSSSWSSSPTCISNSGLNAVLCEQYGYIYYSNDSGKTWRQSSDSPFRYWLSVSISGAYAVACDDSSKNTYYSLDYGATWNSSTTSLPSSCTCVSISGRYAVAGGNGGYIYYSDDSGVTWKTSTSSQESWWRISIDDKNAVACVYNGYIYYSTDYGARWTPS